MRKKTIKRAIKQKSKVQVGNWMNNTTDTIVDIVGTSKRWADGTGVETLALCFHRAGQLAGEAVGFRASAHRCVHSSDTDFSISFCYSKLTFKIPIPSC